MIFSSSWTIFKKSLLILFTILLLFFMFWVFGWVSCQILASCPGIKPAAPVLEGRVLTTRPLAVAILPISHVQLFATPWTVGHQASLLFTISQFPQTHVHWVGDATQPSHPLPLPSPVLNPSQHQSLFQWVSFSHQVAKVLEASASTSVLPMYIQGWFPLGLTGLISPLSKGLSRVFSNTTVWKNQFFGIQASLWSNSHIHTWLLEKP